MLCYYYTKVIQPLNNTKEKGPMQTQTIQFATVKKNNVVKQIGKSTIYQPKTEFKGGEIKWYEDKLKAKKGERDV